MCIFAELGATICPPIGVNGRNSDNTVIKQSLGWEPDTSLRTGMEKTYAWIFDEMTKRK